MMYVVDSCEEVEVALTESVFGLCFSEMFPVHQLVPRHALETGFGVPEVELASKKRRKTFINKTFESI